MRQNTRWFSLILMLSVAVLFLAGCGEQGAHAETDKVNPAVVEPVEGADVNRVTLTERAAERIGIQTVEIEMKSVGGAQRLAIPYSAIVYDINGGTWAYVNSAPLAFQRAPVTVDYIDGDTAYLLDGPEIGTAVATVGVAQLFGADTGVGK